MAKLFMITGAIPLASGIINTILGLQLFLLAADCARLAPWPRV